MFRHDAPASHSFHSRPAARTVYPDQDRQLSRRVSNCRFSCFYGSVRRRNCPYRGPQEIAANQAESFAGYRSRRRDGRWGVDLRRWNLTDHTGSAHRSFCLGAVDSLHSNPFQALAAAPIRPHGCDRECSPSVLRQKLDRYLVPGPIGTRWRDGTLTIEPEPRSAQTGPWNVWTNY